MSETGQNEPTFACESCGTPRTKAEGGTTFTVCDECWDKTSPTPAGAEDLERLVERTLSALSRALGCQNTAEQTKDVGDEKRAECEWNGFEFHKSALSAAIRALTERAEQSEKRGNQIAEDYALAMNEFNLKDAEVAGLREALDAEKAASALAIRLMDKAVILKNEARTEISTLTASHAAAEQERERALRWSWEQCYGASGKIAAIRQEDHIARGLAALRGKGEGE